MSPGTGHQSHEKFLIHSGDVVTKCGFPCGMFKTGQMHDGTANWILERLTGIHSLQSKTRVRPGTFLAQVAWVAQGGVAGQFPWTNGGAGGMTSILATS